MIRDNPIPSCFDCVPREFIRHWNTVDKVEWGEGPWQTEPDKIQWLEPTLGFDCLMKRNEVGVWCGYLGVAPGHPWHGKSPRETGALAHGGLCFADSCDEEGDIATAICHIPFPDRPADVWWIGFDCGHGHDYHPAAAPMWNMLPSIRATGLFTRRGNYRDVPYCVGQILILAVQALRAQDAEVVTIPGEWLKQYAIS